MHELSIAINIVELAEEEARKRGGLRISSVHIEIGTLSNVVQEALEFALNSAVKNTLLQNATFRYDNIIAKATCESCGNVFEPEDFFSPCPECQSFSTEIIQGKELRIRSITMEP